MASNKVDKMNKFKDIAIIIPCYNCENTITNLINQCLEYTKFVYVINDGSTDNSLIKIRDSDAILLNNSRNFGVGYSIKKGIEKAIESGKNNFVTMDGDGGHNPSNIPNLLEYHYKNELELTIGDRWSQNTNSTYYPSPKIWSNKFASALINKVIGSEFNDVACGFRVFGLNAFSIISKSKTRGFDFIYQSLIELFNCSRIGSIKVDCLYNAEELFYTKTEELICLIKSVTAVVQRKDRIFSQLRRTNFLISRYEKIQIEVNGNRIIAFPVKERNGYIFQYQNREFINSEADIYL